MADDKKKNALLGKLLNRKPSGRETITSEGQSTHSKQVESNNDANSEPQWLTDASAESAGDPDEDISEALAELFGEDMPNDAYESTAFNIPGFEELASEGNEDHNLYDSEEGEDVVVDDRMTPEIEDDSEYLSTEGEEFEENEGVIEEDLEFCEDKSEFGDSMDEEQEDDSFEEGAGSASVDEDTATLLAALGYSDANPVARIKSANKDNAKKYTSNLSLAYGYDGMEYSNRSQTESIKSQYAQDKVKTIVRLGATALFAILICVYDLFGERFGGVLDSSVYPVVNIMISLQLLLIAAAFSVKRLISGVNAMFKGTLTVHSISSVAVIIAAIYDIVLAITIPESFTLYNFPAAICLFLCVLHDYFTLEREICVFNRLSSWHSVVTFERVDSASLSSELGEGGSENIDTVGQAFRIRKGDFAENYFRHINRRHPTSNMLAFFVMPTVAIALITFFISLAFNKSFAQAVNVFTGVSLLSLPTFMFVSMVFPFYKLVTKIIGENSVILSEAAVNENKRVDTVVFEEADLFDETSLTINRISVCDKNQMQDVFDIMCAVSAMYNKIGGRIAGVFRASTADGDTPDDVSVIRVDDGGFEGIADGRYYCVGSDTYLASKGIAVTRYYDDKYIESNPGGVVLHIAVDGIEVFKLYLTYNISQNTLAVIKKFAASEVRIVLRTIDPNVNLELISRILSSSFDGNLTLVRKPFSADCEEEHCKNDGTVDGGIIVNGETPAAILDTVYSCRFFSAFSKFDFIAGIVVYAIGVLLAFALGFIGALVDMPSIFIFVFQVVSVLPSIFFASFYLNK